MRAGSGSVDTTVPDAPLGAACAGGAPATADTVATATAIADTITPTRRPTLLRLLTMNTVYIRRPLRAANGRSSGRRVTPSGCCVTPSGCTVGPSVRQTPADSGAAGAWAAVAFAHL